MKKWLSTMLVMFLVMGFLGGCGNNTQAEPPKDGKTLSVVDLYPLEKENYWKYEIEGQANSFVEEKVVHQEGAKAQLEVTDSATVMAIVYEFQGDG